MDQVSVVAFGQTEQENFPLILVFGRESNGDSKVLVLPGVSIYEKTVSSRSSFWNKSLTFMKRCADSSLHLRNQCIRRNSGPVLFTNASPLPIPSGVTNKDHIRASVSPELVEKHISSIFSLDFAKRVKVVVFSTGPNKVFEFAREQVKLSCKEKGISFIDVPYFANPQLTNAVIDQSISIEQKKAIKSVIDAYYKTTNVKI